MRLSKEEFLEIYHEIEKAEEEQEKMQEAMETLCEASFPIIKDPYEGVFYNLMEKLLDDEFFREFIYGGCTMGYIGDKEYDFSNPEEYYNMLADAEKENKQKQEEKTKE
ncbi:MAG: hypothetical protein UHU19_15225 [Lachnospiraceae bacterium]|nr:hypothetical protein [Lachnospiraceae bacterium]